MQAVNTFEGGMNTDLDVSVLPKNTYTYAENLRLNTTNNSSSALENILDSTVVSNIYAFYSGNVTTLDIIGLVSFNDDMYIFVKRTYGIGVFGEILKYKETVSDTYPYLKDGDSSQYNTIKLIYTDGLRTSKLNFNPSYPIKAITRYESDTIQRIYFVDGLNPVRVINVVDSDLSTTEPDNMSIALPINSGLRIIPKNIVKGNLLSGKYQYALQLIKDGKLSKYCYHSDIVSIHKDSLKGDSSAVNSGKGIQLSIPLNGVYDSYKLLRITYGSNANSVVKVDVIEQGNILFDNNQAITIIDSGQSTKEEISLDIYYILNKYNITASEIETKNDMLFLGNISETPFTVTYDTRAYRFYPSTSTSGYANKSIITSEPGSPVSMASDKKLVLASNSDMSAVPAAHNCLNMFNYYRNANNTLVQDTNSKNYDMQYQIDGTTLGGTGVNISYKFTTAVNFPSGYNTSTDTMDYTVTNVNSSSSYPIYWDTFYPYRTNPAELTSELSYFFLTGFQRDEVYRFAIIFIDKYGNETEAKWIGDVRFPDTDWFTSTVTGTSITVNAVPLTIAFTISNQSALSSQGVKYYKIVRCDRTEADKHIKDVGLISTLSGDYKTGMSTNYWSTAGMTANGITNIRKSSNFTLTKSLVYNSKDTRRINDHYFGYISPKEYYGDYVDYTNKWLTITKRVSTNGTLKYKVDSGASFDTISVHTTGMETTEGSNYNITTSPYFIKGTSDIIYNVVDSEIKGLHFTIESNFRLSYNNSLRDNQFTIYNNIDEIGSNTSDVSPFKTSGGSCSVVTANLDLTTYSTIPNGYYYTYAKIVTNDISIYGGYSYDSRLSSSYINSSDIVPLNFGAAGTANSVYPHAHVYGDTSVRMFDYLNSYYDLTELPSASENRLYGNVYIPIETAIDTNLSNDFAPCITHCSITSYGATLANNPILYQPIVGNYSFLIGYGISTTNTYRYNQTRSNYIYYNGYKTYDNGHVFGAGLDTNNPRGNTKIIFSNTKIDGETEDNWLLFLADNYKYVDNKYGTITNLLVHDNYMYCFQEKGLCTLPILERQLVNQDSTNQLALGTGGVLERYDYISNIVGCEYRFGVTRSANYIYWISTNTKGIYRLNNNQVEDISLHKVKSLINNTTSKSLKAFADIKQNEVRFEIVGNDAITKQLVYNEAYNVFSGVYNHIPATYNVTCYHKNNLYYGTLSTGLLRKDNTIVNNNAVYNTANVLTNPVIFEYICNDAYPIVKTFDNVAIRSISTSYKDLYPKTLSTAVTKLTSECFDSMIATTSHQKSISTTLTLNTNITRKEGQFTIGIPRNSSTIADNVIIDNTANLDSALEYRDRMRDNYIKLRFTKTLGNNMFKFPYIVTNYRASKR